MSSASILEGSAPDATLVSCCEITFRFVFSSSSSAQSTNRVSKINASLLAELRPLVPHDVWHEVATHFRTQFVASHEATRRVQEARDTLQHLKDNCAAEEQTRVALLERQAHLEHTKSRLARACARAQTLVEQSKEEKRAIMDEIERLNKDLYEEAGKLVAEETETKRAMEEDQRQTMEAFDKLKSRLLLEKDRCLLAAAQIREARQNPMVSLDCEVSVASDGGEDVGVFVTVSRKNSV
jgi:hypothetical protein